MVSCIRRIQKLKGTLCAALILPAVSALAGDGWHLLIEPKFQGHPSAWLVTGSDRTVFVPARMQGDELIPLAADKGPVTEADRQKVIADTAAAAEKVLDTLEPRYVRDENDVILYAELGSENPLTASAVLAPGFGKLFLKTLGPDLLVAIPNRNRIFVFSKQAPEFQRLTDLVVAEYQSSSYPVSREIFTLKNGKLIAIGRYR